MVDGVKIRDYDPSFFGRSGREIYEQPGLRDVITSPEQGRSFNLMSREGSRNLFNAIIRPSDWRTTLGQQPAAESNYRLDTGEYAPRGSVRARTGLSGLEIRPPSNISDDYLIRGFGQGAFGGEETSFDFTFEDQAPETIARAGNIGVLAQDPSGIAMAQAPFDLSKPLRFSRTSEADFGAFGAGKFSDTGQASANLSAPQAGFGFNNQIQNYLRGSGESQTKEFSGGAGENLATEINRLGSTGELEGQLASLGISGVGKLAGMGAGAALSAANLGMLSNPATALVGLATLPLSYFGGQALGRLASNYRTDRLTDTKATAESGLGSLSTLGLEGPGEFDFSRQAQGQANVTNPSRTGFGLTASDVYTGLEQEGKARLDPKASGRMMLGADIGGVSDTLLREHEIVKKSAGNWDEDRSYSAQAGSEQSQQAGLLGQAQVQNLEQMRRQSVPHDWISQNIDPQTQQNFQAYKERYPGLFGNYRDIDDYITREYFRQNPQAELEFNQLANVDTISNAIATPMYKDTPFQGLDYRQEEDLGVESGGQISLSGPGDVDISNITDVSKTQRTTPQGGAFGSTLGYNAQSIIDAQLQSQLDATLSGAGAQTNAVNQMKFNFNDEEYGATLQLNAQRFINNLEEQIPQTRDSQLFIQSLRDNPELTALFEQGLPPETIVKATMDYDNTNKTFTNKLAWEQNQNYQAAQGYDPTPDQPNSGDEVGLVNIFGDVPQLDPGRLYNVGYKDVISYNTDYKLPTPLTSISNEYLADQYQWDQDLANQLYYYTPGQSELYNTLAQEFINRRYDLTDQYDNTLSDQYLQQISGLSEGQGLEGYSYEDLQNLQDLLQQERQYDIEEAPRLDGQISQEYFIPETVQIDPTFNSPILGVGGGKYKGFYQDPRSGAQLANADVLEKYYDLSKWQPGQMIDQEWAHIMGMAPGYPGAGDVRLDPATGQPLTSARELTPEEFAEAQIKRLPEEYTWEARQYDPLMEKVQVGVQSPFPVSPFPVQTNPMLGRMQAVMSSRLNQPYTPIYQEYQSGWKPGQDTETRTFAENPTKYNTSGLAGGQPMPFLSSLSPFSISDRLPLYAKDPDYLNYDTYQSALSQQIRNYLAQNNLNIPV